MNGKRLISPSLFVIILICFLLPFATISCGGQEAAKLTGLNLVTGTTAGGEKVDANPLAIGAFVAAIAGLGLGFLKGKKGHSASAAMGGLGFIAILALKFVMDSEIEKKGEGMLRIEYNAGFFLLLILFVIAVGVNIFLMRDPTLLQDQHPAPTEEPHKFCTQCGAKNAAGNGFCNECGEKLI